MTRAHRLAAACTALLPALILAGCARDTPNDPASRAATEALGIREDGGRERTTEARHDVLVKDTQEVIDRTTGEVISRKEEITPVTITREKEVETDVNVKVGETKTANP